MTGYLAGHLAGWRDALRAQDQPVLAVTVVSSPPATSAPPAGIPASAVPPLPELQPAQRAPEHMQPSGPVQPSTPATPFPPVSFQEPVAPAFATQQRQATPNNAHSRTAPTPAFVPSSPPPMYPSSLPRQAPRAIDPAAIAAKKSKRETQNINITLYVASLLMVAAAALFVGSSLAVTARLIGVWLGTAVFYAAGLVLHKQVARLKPAAIAFTGTALAIIPFAGLASYNLGFPHAPAVWLFTSLVGTVAYVVAAVRMQSRLIVYLSLAFLLSTAWSSTAVLGAALAWYFAALIVFSALLSLLGNMLAKRGRSGQNGRLAGLYARPLSDLGPWFAPVGLVASLVAATALNAADHLLVLIAGCIYYAVMLFVPSPVPRRWHYVGLRASLTLAAPFAGWMIRPETVWAAGAFTVILLTQIIPLSYGQHRLNAFVRRAGWVRLDALISVPLLAVAGFVWSALIVLGQGTAGNGLLMWGLAAGLIAAIAVAPAMLPTGEWLPAPAIFMIALMSPFLGAVDWIILLALALAYASFRYSTTEATVIKHIALVAARILVTALTAATLVALIPSQPGKTTLIVAAIAVLAGLQLFVDTVLVQRGLSNRVTRYSAAAWTLIGMALVVTLSAAAASVTSVGAQGAGLAGAVPWEFLTTACVMSVATAVYSLSSVAPNKGWAWDELVAPLYLIIAAAVTGPVFNAGGASFAWAVVMGYFLIGGLRLRAESAGIRRWTYWRSARAISILLAIALFQLWRELDRGTSLGSAHVSVGQVLVLALVPQLIVLAVAVLRNRQIHGLDPDMSVSLGFVIVSSGLQRQPSDLAPVLVTAFIAAFAIAALMVVASLATHAVHVTRWVAPVALASMALWNAGHHSVVTGVLIVLLAASVLIAARAQTLTLRSAHFLLARVALTALAGVLADWIFNNPTAVTLVVCATLLAQLPVHRAAIRSAKMTARVGQSLVLMIGGWLLLAALLALPISYFVASGGFGPGGDGLRWVVSIELLALAVAAIVGQTQLLLRGASYLALAAVMGGAGVIAPMLWPGATALILLGLTVVVIAWRWIRPPVTLEMRWYWLVATGAFLSTASVVDHDAATGIFAGMWLVGGLALILGAQLMERAILTLPGGVLVFVAAVLFRFQVLDLTERPGISALAGFLVVMGILYVVRLILLDAAAESVIRRDALVAVALAGGAFFAIWSMADLDTILYGAGAFTIVAGLACLEVPLRARWIVADVAVLTCALVWYIACSVHANLSLFWAVQWCAMALGAMAVMRYLRHLPNAGKRMLMGASGFASFGAVLTIFSGDTVQQVVMLLVFVALIAVGMSLDERVFTIWGAIGVATAVLWYLRGFTYILLAVLALALIGFAIWRLNRRKPPPLPSTTAFPPTPPRVPYDGANPGNGGFPSAEPSDGAGHRVDARPLANPQHWQESGTPPWPPHQP